METTKKWSEKWGKLLRGIARKPIPASYDIIGLGAPYNTPRTAPETTIAVLEFLSEIDQFTTLEWIEQAINIKITDKGEVPEHEHEVEVRWA